jgi:hypothetical protein
VKGKDLQKGIIDLAHTLHWHVVHNPTVETKQGWRTALAADSKGFPDLLLFRERVVAIEVKGDGDRMSSDQLDWRDRMHNANVEHYVIRPADWPDTVKGILE